jgi:hypothetical protein
MAADFVKRLVLLVIALSVATALLLEAMSMLTPAAEAKASPVLLHDQAGAVERGVTRSGDEPPSEGSPLPVVALVFAGILLLATLPPAHRVHVYYHRPPGSYWQ